MIAMPKEETTIQQLWDEIDKLKIELQMNPHPKASKIVEKMEKLILGLRKQEIRNTNAENGNTTPQKPIFRTPLF